MDTSQAQLALLERGVVALESIAHALALATTVQAEQPAGDCTHPPDRRVDFSAGPIEEWECRNCGFRFVGEQAGVK